MKLTSLRRAPLLACASLVALFGLTSCATSTLGYLFVTSAQYGNVASLRLDINTGAIKSVNCNIHNGDQQNCNGGSGGANPTKLLLANSEQWLYVLNGATSSAAGSVAFFTAGSSGSIFTTGESYQTYGQNPIDMIVNGGFLLVLNQYRPADPNNPGCTNPTPSTCQGGIAVFSLDGKGNLNPINCQQPATNCDSENLQYFPIGYVAPALPGNGGNRMLPVSGFLYVLDQGTPGIPEINNMILNPNTGVLSQSGTGPTQNSQFGLLTTITTGSGYFYIADAGSTTAPGTGSSDGRIWIFQPGGNGALSSLVGSVCPSQLVNSTSACDQNPLATGGTGGTPPPVLLDSLLVDGSGYLYAADYNNGVIFSMKNIGTGSILQATPNGGGTKLGTMVTCMTVSSGTEFLYAAGNANVSGEQIDTTTGNLSTNDNPATQASFTGLTPCLVFTPRT